MTTPQSMRERLVEEILKQFEEIEWRQNLARPTVSEVLSSGKSTTTPQKRHVLDIALTTLEAAARAEERERILANILKWSTTATVIETTGKEGAKRATKKLQDSLAGCNHFLYQALRLTPTNPPNTQV